MKTAIRLKTSVPGFRGTAYLYVLDPPMAYEYLDEELEEFVPAEARYVVASATVVPYSGPETYIFPTDAQGVVLDWGELDGSFKGGLDPDQALANAGYEVTDSKQNTSHTKE